MKLSKANKNRIEELNSMSLKVDTFYCDFDTTVESCLWDLEITYNDKFVWIKSSGMEALNERITLSSDWASDDFNYWTKSLRKGLKQAIKIEDKSDLYI